MSATVPRAHTSHNECPPFLLSNGNGNGNAYKLFYFVLDRNYNFHFCKCLNYEFTFLLANQHLLMACMPILMDIEMKATFSPLVVQVVR